MASHKDLIGAIKSSSILDANEQLSSASINEIDNASKMENRF